MGYMTTYMINFVSEILDGNTVVIYPDVDELIYHENLIELLQTFETNFLVTNPIDVIQKIGEEVEYISEKKLFEQRTFCLKNDNPISKWYK
jgi:ABC-type arginine transport system ATPase subunit